MTAPLRVAITHPYSWPEVRRGAERIIVDMARALASAGHEVTVLTSGRTGSTEEVDGYRVRRFRRVFDGSVRHERWFGARVIPALIRGRFDIVHSLMPYDAATASVIAPLCGHRLVYEEMGNPVRELIMGRHDEWARRRLIGHADVFACMSPFSRRFLIDDWGRDGVIIPGGVRTSEHRVWPRSPNPTILFSGAIHRPEKNVPLLLEATAIVASRRPDVELVLSGPGDAAPLLASAPPEARERTTVLPVGEPDQQSERYGSAWVTCLATEWDSFGLVVIESLASGTPVVVGPVGGPADTISSFDDVGVIAAELTPEALASALEAGLGLAEREETVDRCVAAASNFDWDTAMVDLLERVYRDVLAGSSTEDRAVPPPAP